MVKLVVALVTCAGLLVGCKPEEPKFTEPPLGSETTEDFRECKRTSPSFRDSFAAGFELKIGSGFSDHPTDLAVFRQAAERWAEKTGIQLKVTYYAVAAQAHQRRDIR